MRRADRPAPPSDAHIHCRMCGYDFDFPSDVRVGDIIDCPDCRQTGLVTQWGVNYDLEPLYD